MPARAATSHPLALAVTTAVFFLWGFLTGLNDVLIPHLKAVFELNYARSMLIQFTFFGAYFVMSLPAGRVVARLGYRHGMVAGLIVAGLGALAFLPAAQLQSYALFLGALFVLASGITLLQVAANPYVSLLGDEAGASSRLTLAQALNSLGHTLAPAFGGLLILSVAVLGADAFAQLSTEQQIHYRADQAAAVQLPYLGLGLTLFALALFVYLFRLPRLGETTERDLAAAPGYAATLAHRPLRLAIIGIFVYVGAEVSIGSFLINYLSRPEIGAMSEAAAANYVSYYWGGAMLGRFGGSLLLRVFAPAQLLMLFAAIAASLLLTSTLSSGQLALWSIVAVGLFNSILFPTLFTLGIQGLGPLTARGSSLLVMAIVGGAVVPLLQGLLADRIGLQPAFVLPLACYAYIVWYGWQHGRSAAAARAVQA
ncbi:sugar MFS transporter [Tahibacter harae]|uniref:Sugar MFS transporter n=1 Tax=Tahibacter harae TaxID=2963937 RepID=A0ABT1QRG3_9GAMM|nr:sugar MFS transporter [Tahibacter harae]MCQ4164893.1 sugar MFS transporter [Tahibacter harae]